MKPMLFKHFSEVARHAALDIVPPEPPLPPEPRADPRDIEIAGLQAEVARLEASLREIESDRDRQIANEREAARQEAARAHVRDDARIADALEHTLAAASESFAGSLADEVAPLAARLAARAVEQLVALEQDEREWLQRVVARRLAGVATETVVALHVAPADVDDTLERLLQTHSGAQAQLKRDHTLVPGTARIVLTLGEIEVRPEEGAYAIVRLLEQAGGADA